MISYFDMHCDTLCLGFRNQAEDIYDMPKAMLDIKRMAKAGMYGQFFAIFFPPKGREGMPEDEVYYEKAKELFYRSLLKYQDIISFAGNYEDIVKNRSQGKMSALLTLEDGRLAGGSCDKLKELYEDGIRLITLTWNGENCFGAPNSPDPVRMEQGLTAFGCEAVERMSELGMLVDVSHLSDGGFYDVAKLLKKPFAASHSNARSLCGHQRNLTDDMIKILAEHGGIAGINFCPEFLSCNNPDRLSRVNDLAAHIRYMAKVGGEDLVALGTDFDGIGGKLEIGAPDSMHLLFECLEREGFSQSFIEKVAYKNLLRVIKDTLK